MSTLMLLRVPGNAKELERLAQENPDVLAKIAEKAKGYGVMRHRFFATQDEIMVVDEWPSADAFQRFYADSPEIGDLMGKVGVTTEPTITFADGLMLGDEVG
jgi:hypothetical protein